VPAFYLSSDPHTTAVVQVFAQSRAGGNGSCYVSAGVYLLPSFCRGVGHIAVFAPIHKRAAPRWHGNGFLPGYRAAFGCTLKKLRGRVTPVVYSTRFLVTLVTTGTISADPSFGGLQRWQLWSVGGALLSARSGIAANWLRRERARDILRKVQNSSCPKFENKQQHLSVPRGFDRLKEGTNALCAIGWTLGPT
jgi:hypothetical protein